MARELVLAGITGTPSLDPRDAQPDSVFAHPAALQILGATHRSTATSAAPSSACTEGDAAAALAAATSSAHRGARGAKGKSEYVRADDLVRGRAKGSKRVSRRVIHRARARPRARKNLRARARSEQR
jgi:hypothetical protein